MDPKTIGWLALKIMHSNSPAKCVEKWNTSYKLRVTSSNIRVTSSNLRVISPNPPVISSNKSTSYKIQSMSWEKIKAHKLGD